MKRREKKEEGKGQRTWPKLKKATDFSFDFCVCVLGGACFVTVLSSMYWVLTAPPCPCVIAVPFTGEQLQELLRSVYVDGVLRCTFCMALVVCSLFGSNRVSQLGHLANYIFGVRPYN